MKGEREGVIGGGEWFGSRMVVRKGGENSGILGVRNKRGKD